MSRLKGGVVEFLGKRVEKGGGEEEKIEGKKKRLRRKKGWKVDSWGEKVVLVFLSV